MYDKEKKLGYQFSDQELVHRAMYHPSMVDNPRQRVSMSNQRLEFLGDAVLELVISEALYARFPRLSEGELTRRRAALVQESHLSRVAKEIGLGDWVIMNKGEERTGGRDKPSILSDALEALFGAIYLDGGLQAAREVILRLIDVEAGPKNTRDAKSSLQEYLQSRGHASPVYQLVEESGPAHERHFVVHALVDGEMLGAGAGKSKKNAEQAAAAEAMKNLEG